MTSSGEKLRRRSCGAAEIGVILSDCSLGSQINNQAGPKHLMDDITAEVDEREEYSNDFEDEINEGKDHSNNAINLKENDFPFKTQEVEKANQADLRNFDESY